MAKVKEYKSLKRCKHCRWEGFTLSSHRHRKPDGHWCYSGYKGLETIPQGEVTDLRPMMSVARGRVGSYERRIDVAEITHKNIVETTRVHKERYEWALRAEQQHTAYIETLKRDLERVRGEEDEKLKRREAREAKRLAKMAPSETTESPENL